MLPSSDTRKVYLRAIALASDIQQFNSSFFLNEKFVKYSSLELHEIILIRIIPTRAQTRSIQQVGLIKLKYVNFVRYPLVPFVPCNIVDFICAHLLIDKATVNFLSG